MELFFLTPLTFHLQSSALKEENSRLTAELREAREKIRNLELQVEGIKANTRKAVEALSLS
jgi:coronin-1B/1C/6